MPGRWLILFFWGLVLSIHAASPPKIVLIAGEFEYHSKDTLPVFARDLARTYNVQTVVLERPSDEKAQTIPGLDQLKDADLVILFIRRMTLPEHELAAIRAYIDSGRPLLGIRTASHSFQNWLAMDREVLGGNYQGHHGNKLKTTVTILPEGREHPILRGVNGFVSDGSLYRNTPLAAASKPLLQGKVDGHPAEPVAWTHEYKGARVFYTSLGHPNDFKVESFQALLQNAIGWCIGRDLERRSQ